MDIQYTTLNWISQHQRQWEVIYGYIRFCVLRELIVYMFAVQIGSCHSWLKHRERSFAHFGVICSDSLIQCSIYAYLYPKFHFDCHIFWWLYTLMRSVFLPLVNPIADIANTIDVVYGWYCGGVNMLSRNNYKFNFNLNL